MKSLGIAPYLIGPTRTRFHHLGRETKCQLRLCSHTLAVETGRWGHYTARALRTCTLCGGGVEDAKHFAVHCSEQKELFRNFADTVRRDVSRIVELSQPPTETQRTRLFALMMSDDCPSGMETEQWLEFESKVEGIRIFSLRQEIERRAGSTPRSEHERKAGTAIR